MTISPPSTYSLPTPPAHPLVIVHLALGGCLKAPPIDYGVTSDTGGHIAYVLGAALAQGERDDVAAVSIVTRRFAEPCLSSAHALSREALTDKVSIDRLSTGNSRYLEKAELTAELGDLGMAFLAHLRALPRLPDIIHAHFADAAGLAALARRAFGIPYAYTPHSLGLDKRKAGLPDQAASHRLKAEEDALRTASLVIASSQDECTHQIGAYAAPLLAGTPALILPGIPAHAALAPTGKPNPWASWFAAPDRPIVLAIARPVRRKNLIALLRAYAGCEALRERCNLVILAGQRDGMDGAEEAGIVAELDAFVAAHGLQRQVALPSSHGPEEVAALYRKAATGGVFVNCALHEPFGLTLVEAAAAGVPVVATECGGPSEIIANLGHGLLVDPLDDAAIASACLAIVSDPHLHARLSASGRRHAPLYSWSRYAEDSTARYRGVCGPRLVVCDIDATLTGCMAGAEAFRRWRADSPLGFAVATGRSLTDAMAVLRQWDLPQPDAFIVDVGTRIVLRDHAGDWSTFEPYSTKISSAWSRSEVERVVAGLALEPQPDATRSRHKTSYFGTALDARRVRERLSAAGLKARVIASHGNLIDVIPHRAGKAAAVEAYASSLGLRLDQCVAAGDSGNDLDMVERCGLAIIVSNATAELDDVPPRTGLYRARRPHAFGVMEGLSAFGLVA